MYVSRHCVIVMPFLFLLNLTTSYPAQMPILVNKLVFSLIPSHAPFFIRPLLWVVFSQVDKQFIAPELKKNNALIDEHLKKREGGWFAGGEHPTSADYMMLFPMEAMVARGGAVVGARLKEWVERVHARPAYQRVSTLLSF